MSLASRAALGLCFVAACTDHLSIGSFDEVVDPLDGAVPLDASAPVPPPVVTPGPLQAKLRVVGRDDYSQVLIKCGGPCFGVEVEIAGGTPPYELTWSDGVRVANRQFCYPRTTTARSYSASIVDATGQQRGVNLQTEVLVGRQDCQGEPSVQVCVAPSPTPLTCAEERGLWYPLHAPLLTGSLEARAAFGPPLQSEGVLELGVASRLCGEVQVVARGTVSLPVARLAGTTTGSQPQGFLVVRAPDAIDGRPSADFEPIALGLCFAP